jgi:hypothetical protein
MRVPNAVHQRRPWVISDIAPDFTLLDVWALPVHGGRDDFDAAVKLVSSFDPANAPGGVTRVLFSVRLFLGRLLHWDDHDEARPIPGCIETTLTDRLPQRLRGTTEPVIGGPLDDAAGGFVPLYRTDDEWAAEISNATVHGVLQLTWVQQEDGRYRAHIGVYVKPRGRLGELYMLLIQPFRHLIVYPALMRRIGRVWRAHDAAV